MSPAAFSGSTRSRSHAMASQPLSHRLARIPCWLLHLAFLIIVCPWLTPDARATLDGSTAIAYEIDADGGEFIDSSGAVINENNQRAGWYWSSVDNIAPPKWEKSSLRVYRGGYAWRSVMNDPDQFRNEQKVIASWAKTDGIRYFRFAFCAGPGMADPKDWTCLSQWWQYGTSPPVGIWMYADRTPRLRTKDDFQGATTNSPRVLSRWEDSERCTDGAWRQYVVGIKWGVTDGELHLWKWENNKWALKYSVRNTYIGYHDAGMDQENYTWKMGGYREKGQGNWDMFYDEMKYGKTWEEAVAGFNDPVTVKINQASGQADPVNAGPFNFTAVFSEPVTGFTDADVRFGGSAKGTRKATVTGSGTTYNVAVSGITGPGTVTATVAANAVDGGNLASTSTDNTVTYDTTPPKVTINQAERQGDPTKSDSINFTVVFNEPVKRFRPSDVSVEGTAPGKKSVEVTGDGPTYKVSVSGMTSKGTVIAKVLAGVTNDLAGNPNRSSTSTDNKVTYSGSGAKKTARRSPASGGTETQMTNEAPALMASSPLTHASDLRLAAVFSDQMVLQRNKPVPVWGWGNPGEGVTVTFGGQTRTATAGADGKWTVSLASMAASSQPRNLVVTSNLPGRSLTVEGVLVGEVWLGSGQSNMEMKVRHAQDFAAEQAASNLPQIRVFTDAGTRPVPVPQAEGSGRWVVCAPQSVGDFSATLYFFGREIHRELGVPVGLIDSSVGGTRIMSWIEPQAQLAVPELKAAAEAVLHRSYTELNPLTSTATYLDDVAVWEAAGADWEEKPDDPLRGRAKTVLGGLFNSKIAPWIPCALRGVLWYQGEAHARDELWITYQQQQELLINDWRARWGEDLPFAWVQLPNVGKLTDGSGSVGWNMVREAQRKALRLPNTGMAVAVDISSTSIHPPNKQEVGRRLSLWALGDVYGQSVAATSGPLPISHAVSGNQLTVTFDHVAGGLQAKSGALVGFEITGANYQWQVATAAISGNNKVVLSSPNVAQPVAARYGWASILGTNLINSAGLPAATFHTGNLTPPTVTINHKSGEADPKSAAPVNFTVVFSEPVTGFATGEVTISGTAPGTKTATVSQIAPNDGTTYNVAVTGMTGNGTVIANIGYDVARNTADIPNAPSTSTKNRVYFGASDTTKPSVTINQSGFQADPVPSGPVDFRVVFNEPVTGFVTGDVTISGTAPGTKTAAVSQIAPNDGTTYNVSVSGMTGNGTVIASIAAGKAQDSAGNTNNASTSTDNKVTLAPVDATAPTVTIKQKSDQADPTNTPPINFTVEFSETVMGFEGNKVVLGGTAPGALKAIATGSGTTYNVAVSGMTGNGTVTADILSGAAFDLTYNPSKTATSTDNSVTYNPTAAGYIQWDGGSTANSSWATAANWAGDAVPTSAKTTDVGFHTPAATRLDTFLGDARTVRSITFNANADAPITIRQQNIAGTSGTLARNLTLSSSTGTSTITVESGAAGSVTFTSATSGQVRFLNNVLIDHNGSQILGITRFTDAGVSAAPFPTVTKRGSGRFQLGAASQIRGTTRIEGGTLRLGASTHGLKGPVTIGSATLDGGTYRVTAGTLTLTGTARIQLGTGAKLAFANSSAVNWGSGTLALGGTFVSGSSLRFGTTATGLTASQLAKISATGFTGFALNSTGFLTAKKTSTATAKSARNTGTGFTSWQDANGTTGGVDQDHDGDGVSNGVEHFLGGGADTGGPTALPGVTLDDGVPGITWTMAPDYEGAYGVNFHVETSDLPGGPWTAEAVDGGNVGINGRDVTYTFPAPLGTGRFLRLVVTSF